jgi:hypothetical protein
MGDDRHGRLRRSVDDARRRPPEGFRARDARRFHQLLEAAVGDLPVPAASALQGAVFDVRDVPDPATGPSREPVVVTLAEAHASGRHVHRLVVYRRPAELRAAGRDDLVELLREAVLEAVADALGVDPELWDEL